MRFIKIKLKIMFIFVFVFSTIYPLPYVKANELEPPNYEGLMQYDGFVQTLYKHGVELQTFVAGKYTNNVDWVRENIVDVVSNAGTYIDELKQNGDVFFAQPIGEQYKDLTSMIIGVPVTAINIIGSFFGKLFEDNTSTIIPDENEFYNKGQNDIGEVILLNGIDVIATHPTRYSSQANSYMYWYSQQGSYGTSYYVIKDGRHTSNAAILLEAYYEFGDTEENKIKNLPSNSMNAIFALAEKGGYTLTIVEDSTTNPVNIFNQITSPEISNITNYINENGLSNIIPQNYKPVISSYLVCGDEIHNLTITGTTFTTADGTVIDVAPDETAILNGIPCNLNWKAPEVTIDEKENILITDTDGKQINLEDEKYKEETGESCDGVFCFLKLITKAISGIVSSITSLVDSISTLIIDLIDKLFHLIVPENLDFITDLFDTLKTTFTEKFAITTDIQNLFKSIFTESTTNPLTDLSFTLPATDTELSFGVFAVVDDYVPMIKRIISALLALMTLMYVYRKITGSGGVMEK